MLHDAKHTQHRRGEIPIYHVVGPGKARSAAKVRPRASNRSKPIRAAKISAGIVAKISTGIVIVAPTTWDVAPTTPKGSTGNATTTGDGFAAEGSTANSPTDWNGFAAKGSTRDVAPTTGDGFEDWIPTGTFITDSAWRTGHQRHRIIPNDAEAIEAVWILRSHFLNCRVGLLTACVFLWCCDTVLCYKGLDFQAKLVPFDNNIICMYECNFLISYIYFTYRGKYIWDCNLLPIISKQKSMWANYNNLSPVLSTRSGSL